MTSLADAKAIKSKKKLATRPFKSYLFTLFLKMQLEENRQGRSFTRINIYAYYIIITFSCMPANIFKTLIDNWIFERESEAILSFCIAAWMVLVLTQAFLVISERYNNSNHKILVMSIQLSSVYSHWLYPLKIMIMSGMVAQSFNPQRKDATLDPIAGSVSILAIMVWSSYTFVLSKIQSELPSSFSGSLISTDAKAISILAISCVQVANAFNLEYGNRSMMIDYILYIVCLVVLILIVIYCIVRRMHWDPATNNQVVSCGVKLVCFLLFTKIFEDRISGVGMLFYLIVQAFITRLALICSIETLKIDVFRSDVSCIDQYVGIVMMNKYIMCREYRDLDESERILYLYYTGIWKEFKQSDRMKNILGKTGVLAKGRTADKSNDKSGEEQDIVVLIGFLMSRHKQNPYYFKIVSLLQIKDISAHFRHASQLYSNFRQANGTGFFEELQNFQLQVIWEFNIQMMDKYSQDSSHSLSMNVIDSFDSLTAVLEGKEITRGSSIDLRSVFDSILQFDLVSSSVENILVCQVNLFDKLHEGTNIGARNCKEMNDTTYNARQVCMKEVRSFIENNDHSSFSTYFYPVLIYYYSLMQFEVEKSDHFIILYKKKLQSMLMRQYSMRRGEKDISEFDSVIIHSSLAKDTMGLILDTSLNFNHYLGDKTSVSIVGQNISTFLPQVLADKHHRSMDSDKVKLMLNKNREVVMVDMIGNLKLIKINVKIAPSITKPPSSFSMMDFDSTRRGPCLLLDIKQNILASDITMNRIIETKLEHASTGKSRKAQADLENLSKKLSISLKLVQKITSYFADVQKSNKLFKQKLSDSDETLKDRLFSLFSMIADNNSASGMMYNIEKGSVLHQKTGREYLHIRFEFDVMIGVQVTKVFISRKDSAERRDKLNRGGVVNKGEDLNYVEIGGEENQSDEEVKTNKAVREHVQQDEVVAANSEQKSSMINMRGRRNQKENDQLEDILHDFEDLLLPTAELMEFAMKKLVRNAGNGEGSTVAEVSNSMIDASQVMEGTDRNYDTSVYIQEIITLIQEIKSINMAAREEKNFHSQPSNGSWNHESGMMVLQSNTYLDDERTKSDIFNKTPRPIENKHNKDNKMVPFSSNFNNPSATMPMGEHNDNMKIKLLSYKIPAAPKRTIGEIANGANIIANVKKNTVKIISKPSSQAESQDILSWMKKFKKNKMDKMKSRMKKDIDDVQTKGTHPNIASYQTLGTILTYFKVTYI